MLERFMSKIEPVTETGCWLWTGSVGHKDYGQFQIGTNRHRKLEGAHRTAWRLFKGTIPQGMCVLHKCDVSCCVRPDHLFLGTIADNNRDMWTKGRGWSPFAHRNRT